MKKKNLGELTITELVKYKEACSIVINKILEETSIYRNTNERQLNDTEKERYTKLTKEYLDYQTLNNKIIEEIKKRLNELC